MKPPRIKRTPGLDHINTVADAIRHNLDAGGSRDIQYGGMGIIAPMAEIQEAIEFIRELTAEQRRGFMASVNATLARDFPKVKSGRASAKFAVRCGQNIAIWFANEVFEGRASLEIN